MPGELVYALVARGSTILAEYTGSSGNFTMITQVSARRRNAHTPVEHLFFTTPRLVSQRCLRVVSVGTVRTAASRPALLYNVYKTFWHSITISVPSVLNILFVT